MLTTGDNGDNTLTMVFQPGLTGLAFASNILQIFNGTTWIASTAVAGSGNTIRTFTNPALNGMGGQLWRLTNPPPPVQPNQSGVTTA